MTFTLRVLSCLLTGAFGYVAPSVVVPPVAKPVVGALPPQPAIPSGGAPAQSPGAHARYAAAPTANAAVHRVPRTIDQPLTRRSVVDAEAKLTEIFGSTSPRQEQIDAGVSQAFLSETGAATAPVRMFFGGLLLAAVTGMVAASRLWWSRAVVAGKPAVSATTAELQMSSVVDRAAASASSSSSWNPQAMVAAMGLLAGVAGGGQPALAADLENGEGVFNGNCAACHAGGNNSVQTEKKIKKPELEKYLTGGYNIDAIKYQVTNGKNSMPAFGEKLGPDDIEDVATWVYEQAPKWS